jgi:hypothetical protein
MASVRGWSPRIGLVAVALSFAAAGVLGCAQNEACRERQAALQSLLRETDAPGLSAGLAEMRAAGCLTFEAYAVLAQQAEAESTVSELQRALVDVDPTLALQLFSRAIGEHPALSEESTRGAGYWLPRLTQRNEDDAVFDVLSTDGSAGAFDAPALSARISVARSFVCSRPGAIEPVALAWHAQLERAIESGEIDPQRGLMLRAELNLLLREIGTGSTLEALIASLEQYEPFGPAWLLIDGFGLLTGDEVAEAYPLLLRAAQDTRHELPVRVRALESLVVTHPDSAEAMVRQIAQGLRGEAERESLMLDDVQAALSSLERPREERLAERRWTDPCAKDAGSRQRG